MPGWLLSLLQAVKKTMTAAMMMVVKRIREVSIPVLINVCTMIDRLERLSARNREKRFRNRENHEAKASILPGHSRHNSYGMLQSLPDSFTLDDLYQVG